ncbi:type II secretion system F family protein [Sulfitobacter sp. HNIBRBA2951]|uniref:type II secretion system F family protein n=1 Tax=Sulfitobacter aquimarinus TaxID=3158557 RepID=UPI0032DE94F4
MPLFSYSAYTASGALETGEVQAPSDVAALDQLSAQGLTPVSLKAGGQSLPWWQRDLSFGGAQSSKPDALEHFFKTLAGLLKVRLALLRSLRFCEGNTKDRAMAQALSRVQRDVRDGSTLGQALRSAGSFFPDRLVTMVEIGEAADRLADVTDRIAVTLASEAEQRRELRGALIYPVILVVMSLLVMALLVFFLAPTLAPVFASADAELPTVLRLMVGLREVILAQWPAILIAFCAVLMASRLLRHPVRNFIARIALRLPILGGYLRQSETLKILQTLALMLSSGASLPRAMATARATTRHPAYRALLTQTEDRIMAGGALSDGLSRSPLVDPMAGAMLEAGEETDQMIPVLDQLVIDLRARSARTLAQAIRLITPLITLVIGVSVGGIILSTVSAIMSLNDVAF